MTDRYFVEKGKGTREDSIRCTNSLHRIVLSCVSPDEEVMTRAGVRLAKNQRAVMAAIRVLPVSLAAGTRFRYQPVTFSVVEATGIYASDVRVVEEGLLGHAAGLFLLPFDDDPNTTLQDNILTAWEAGQIVGADVVGVISGNYVVPEPSTISLAALGLFGGACVLLRKKVMP